MAGGLICVLAVGCSGSGSASDVPPAEAFAADSTTWVGLQPFVERATKPLSPQVARGQDLTYEELLSAWTAMASGEQITYTHVQWTRPMDAIDDTPISPSLVSTYVVDRDEQVQAVRHCGYEFESQSACDFIAQNSEGVGRLAADELDSNSYLVDASDEVGLGEGDLVQFVDSLLPSQGDLSYRESLMSQDRALVNRFEVRSSDYPLGLIRVLILTRSEEVVAYFELDRTRPDFESGSWLSVEHNVDYWLIKDLDSRTLISADEAG